MAERAERRVGRSALAYGAVVLALHGAGLLGLLAGAGQPGLRGLALVAYTLGLRHAFDADHITAIDNAVRKLTRDGRDGSGSGFFFSLGHSSVVLLATALSVLAFRRLSRELPSLEPLGQHVGLAVSSLFLLAIGLANLLVLLGLFRLARRPGGAPAEEDGVQELLERRGGVARLAQPLFALVRRSWHLYPVGFLFGLGFDTASEVLLLALALQASRQATVASILVLPLLFAAGMSLVDTADGLFMSGAYRWASAAAPRRLAYNLAVTSVSVLAALLVGSVELAQVVADWLHPAGAFWAWVAGLGFDGLGYALAALLALSWAVAWLSWRLLESGRGSEAERAA